MYQLLICEQELFTHLYLPCIVLKSFKDYKFSCISIQTVTYEQANMRTANIENQGLILR